MNATIDLSVFLSEQCIPSFLVLRSVCAVWLSALHGLVSFWVLSMSSECLISQICLSALFQPITILARVLMFPIVYEPSITMDTGRRQGSKSVRSLVSNRCSFYPKLNSYFLFVWIHNNMHACKLPDIHRATVSICSRYVKKTSEG